MRRCAIFTPLDELAELFAAELADGLEARFRRSRDIGPPKPVLGLRLVDGKRVIDAYRWGFIPPFARRPPLNTFQAQSESLLDRRMYATAFLTQRLIFVADFFYLWLHKGRKYTGYAFRNTNGDPLALAALWGPWQDPRTGEEMQSCAVITGPANSDVQPISTRMPIELSPLEIDDWLDPELQDAEILESMLTPVVPGTFRRSRMRIPGMNL